MSLLRFAIAGSVVSLLMIAAGLVWLGVRREFEVSRMNPEDAADMVVRGWRGRPAAVWFRGMAAGMSAYAEKPTSEILALLAAGRFREGLPWATPALGVVAAFFFWPLLVGVLTGMRGALLWGMVAFFFVGCLMAAWPRETEE